MKLKNQVCSLKLAKELKRLGVKQKSLWYWYCDEERDDTDILNRDEKYAVVGFFTHKYSAFTVAELGKKLPNDYFINQSRTIGGFFRFDFGDQEAITAKTEAEARAMMLIYLKKQEGK